VTDDLDGDIAIEQQVMRTIDFAHAAAAEFGVDAIALTQGGADREMPQILQTYEGRWLSMDCWPA